MDDFLGPINLHWIASKHGDHETSRLGKKGVCILDSIHINFQALGNRPVNIYFFKDKHHQVSQFFSQFLIFNPHNENFNDTDIHSTAPLSHGSPHV